MDNNYLQATNKMMRIMCVGDSITVGVGTQTNYRAPLGERLRAIAANTAFVGPYNDTMTSEASQCAAISGIWAKTVNESYIVHWTTASQPDIALVHLGTNDIFNGASVNSVIDALSGIITKMRNIMPSIKIYMAQIIGTTNTLVNSKIVELNQRITQLVQNTFTAASPVYLVDQYSGFEPSVDTSDGVHPVVHGQYKMSQKWFQAFLDSGLYIYTCELSNVALSKALSISLGPQTAYDISLAFDNRITDPHFFREAPSQWVEIDLGAAYKLYYLEFIHFGFFSHSMPEQLYNTRSYTIESSIDKQQWDILASVVENVLGRTTHILAGKTARYLRLNVVKANGFAGSNQFRLREFRVMGHPQINCVN